MKLTDAELSEAICAACKSAVEAVLAHRQPAQSEDTMDLALERAVYAAESKKRREQPTGDDLCESGLHYFSDGKCTACHIAQPPAHDVVSRMLVAFEGYEPSHLDGQRRMTAAAQVCIEDRDKQWEQAIISHLGKSFPAIDGLLSNVRARLSAKPQHTLEVIVETVLANRCGHVDQRITAAQIIAALGLEAK